jgi:hypothetical protein
VIDEDAYYNQKDNVEEEKKGISPSKKTPGASYDSHPKEPNLARKLGLNDEDDEDTLAQKAKDKNRKKTKEELEKEKEIDEVRQIIENDSKLSKYIKEVDLLGVDLDQSPGLGAQSGKQKAGTSSRKFTHQTTSTCWGRTWALHSAGRRAGSAARAWTASPRTSSASRRALSVDCVLTADQAGPSKNVTYNRNGGPDAAEFGEFHSADDPRTGFGKQYKKEEMDLLNFGDMAKKV